MPEDRPEFLNLLDRLLERLEKRENGVDVVSEAPSTPAALNTRHSPKMEALNNG